MINSYCVFWFSCQTLVLYDIIDVLVLVGNGHCFEVSQISEYVKNVFPEYSVGVCVQDLYDSDWWEVNWLCPSRKKSLRFFRMWWSQIQVSLCPLFRVVRGDMIDLILLLHHALTSCHCTNDTRNQENSSLLMKKILQVTLLGIDNLIRKEKGSWNVNIFSWLFWLFQLCFASEPLGWL